MTQTRKRPDREHCRLLAVIMTQRMFECPDPPDLISDFWTSAYQAIDD